MLCSIYGTKVSKSGVEIFKMSKETLLRFTNKRCREDTLHSVLALGRRLTEVAAELYPGCGKV